MTKGVVDLVCAECNKNRPLPGEILCVECIADPRNSTSEADTITPKRMARLRETTDRFLKQPVMVFPNEDAAQFPWRTGRKVGRTIYVQLGEEPSDDDPLIGVMDTPEMAALVVEARNMARGDGMCLVAIETLNRLGATIERLRAALGEIADAPPRSLTVTGTQLIARGALELSSDVARRQHG